METEGLVNVYTCRDCHARHVTRNVDSGVTPFGIRCRSCGGHRAYSACYRVDQSLMPGFEWYRPDGDELAGLDPETREHVGRGGLLLRELPARREPSGMGWG